ncbi:3'-5' exonuclease [Agarivorans sp.]|uniref:3'-5' exonuclease n=1 Tax=Agarivorans sp. TaxID=1872412 RepID=UPI003CFED23F
MKLHKLPAFFPFSPPGRNWQTQYALSAEQANNAQLKHFYQHGMIGGETPLSEVPFVALDLETTGLDPQRDDIISIGLVPFDMRRIYCHQAKHWLIRPLPPLNSQSVVIHGITHSDIADAPNLNQMIEPLLKALEGKVVVVHYQAIERNFLAEAFKKRLHEEFRFPLIDTMEIEANIHRQLSRNWWQNLLGKKTFSLRLAASRQRYGLPFYQSHHALIDAQATAELFIAQVRHHLSVDIAVDTLWR